VEGNYVHVCNFLDLKIKSKDFSDDLSNVYHKALSLVVAMVSSECTLLSFAKISMSQVVFAKSKFRQILQDRSQNSQNFFKISYATSTLLFGSIDFNGGKASYFPYDKVIAIIQGF
jgi:hypothetical protein